MALFTPRQKKQLTELLSHAANKDRVFALNELHGFLFGLAITPELIPPSEWLPAVFGAELPAVSDVQESERLLNSLFSLYHQMVESAATGALAFPFDISRLKGKDVPAVRQWCYGLFHALMLRPGIWHLPRKGAVPSDDVIDITTSTAIVIGVALPEKIPDLSALSRLKALLADQNPAESAATLLAVLPAAITSMQKFAQAVKDGLPAPLPRKVLRPEEPLAVTKPGRNEPCPCGSDLKYKKCCGR